MSFASVLGEPKSFTHARQFLMHALRLDVHQSWAFVQFSPQQLMFLWHDNTYQWGCDNSIFFVRLLRFFLTSYSLFYA